VIRDLSYNGLASDQGPRANGQYLMIKLQVSEAIRACLEKKAEEITILELEKGSGAFTDYFVVCSGTNPRQVYLEARLQRSLALARQEPERRFLERRLAGLSA